MVRDGDGSTGGIPLDSRPSWGSRHSSKGLRLGSLSVPPSLSGMPKGPWVLVIGSHRSGTSALTGGMGALGLALPRDEDRLEWEESNPDHFESVGMLLFDERVLRSLGGTWQRPPKIPEAWVVLRVGPSLRR